MEPIQQVETAQLLEAAIKEASRWEDDLSAKGERRKGQAEKAFEAMKNGHVELGQPQAQTQHLTPKDFETRGLELAPEIKKSMQGKEGYAFYVMPVPVLLFPGRGAQYRLLESHFALSVGRGQRKAVIHSIFPEPVWKPVLDWGGELQLALDSGLQWGAEVEQTEVKLAKLGGELAGRVKNLNQLASFVKVFQFEHTLGRMEIEAQFAASTAMWRLDSKKVIKDQKHMQFILLLQVPKEVGQVRIKAATQAEVAFDWLTAQVERVFDHLPQAIQQIVKAGKGLPLQDFQTWTIDLPA